VHWHEIRHRDGGPLLDIEDAPSASAYWRGVYTVLREYAVAGDTVHLLIAGGRKAMSVYAAMAASLTFTPRDRLFTVLSPKNLVERTAQFHIPPGQRDQVHVVALPVLPLRLPPGEAARLLPSDPQQLIDARRNPANALREALTPQELRLAEWVCEHPYADARELGRMLGKSGRTVERQLQDIYAKLMSQFDLPGPVQPQHKRQLLLDVLRDGAT
jgi:CRISPR-associated protein Csx14